MASETSSQYYPGIIVDLMILFFRGLYGHEDYYEEYRYNPNDELTKIQITGPWTRNLSVQDYKPAIVVSLGDFVFQNAFIGDVHQMRVDNFDKDITWWNTEADLIRTNATVSVKSTDYLEADRILYLSMMGLRVYRKGMMAMSAGRIVDFRVQSVGRPRLYQVDSATEGFEAVGTIDMMLRDIWACIDEDAMDLGNIDIGFCDDLNIKNLLVRIEPEEE